MNLSASIPKTALVATSRLVDFAGAEITTIEIACALREIGIQVKVAALEIGEPIRNELVQAEMPFVDLHSESIVGAEYDLLWVTHNVVAYHLVTSQHIRAKWAIFSSLSHFEPLESPPLPTLSFSLYTVNSEENRSSFCSRFPALRNRVVVFPNFAPVSFLSSYRTNLAPRILKLAIISNHPPVEIIELSSLLRSHSVHVDIIGVQGRKTRVTPALLDEYDAVITIGKSVQYCLATGTPVYCYDRFGGPGWITPEVIDTAAEKNFSGRCTPNRRPASTILRELMEGYANAAAHRTSLRESVEKYFHVRRNLLSAISSCMQKQFATTMNDTEKNALSSVSESFLRQRQTIANCHLTIANKEVELREALSKLSISELQHASATKELNERNSALRTLEAALGKADSERTDLRRELALRNADCDSLSNTVSGLRFKLEKGMRAIKMNHSRIAALENAVAGREARVTELENLLVIRNGEIDQLESTNDALKSTLHDQEQTLHTLRTRVEGLLGSRSWRFTSPIRRLSAGTRGTVARLRALSSRSVYVLRQEGVIAFCGKSYQYCKRRLKRHVASKILQRAAEEASALRPAGISPLVTFVIPIYNRTDVLRTAIRSALEQTVNALELILVTDGSPPETHAVVDEFRSDPRVRVFSYPVSSGNAVRGRNKGILEARGKYIAFLDSDDIAAPNRLELSLPFLESGQADVVYGGWRALLDGTREVAGLQNGQVVYSPDCDFATLEKVCVPCQSTVTVRREFLLKSGFLKPKMQYREDHELWVRLAHHGAVFKSIPAVLVDLRLHAGNNELNFKGNDNHWEALLNQEYSRPGPIPKKIGFLLAGLGISGGAAVVLQHVSLLMQAGHDAFVIALNREQTIDWFGNPAIRVFGIEELAGQGFDNIDLLFATFWTTTDWLDQIPARRKLYFVQSDERLFYEEESLKARVAATYSRDYEYVVIAPWIARMLQTEFGKTAVCVPNGLDQQRFYPGESLEPRKEGRPRVLIEGPISVPFKGMSDAYAAVSDLDCDLWIVSSDGQPERHWRYERFFARVSNSDMRKIYASCDVLLKMSRVESFAYPPLEAMACGCAVVLGEVNGGIEYAQHGKNLILVPQGDVSAARDAVAQVLQDLNLRRQLVEGGFATVPQWSWERSRDAMLALVESMRSNT